MKRNWCIKLLLALCEGLQGKVPTVLETVTQKRIGNGCGMSCLCNISFR